MEWEVLLMTCKSPVADHKLTVSHVIILMDKKSFFKQQKFTSSYKPMSSLYQRKNPSAHLREEVVHSEKWLRLTKLHYIDENQVERVRQHTPTATH